MNHSHLTTEVVSVGGQDLIRPIPARWYCGCCGRTPARDSEWCARCLEHLSPDLSLNPWDRTYYAQHGESCPYQIRSK